MTLNFVLSAFIGVNRRPNCLFQHPAKDVMDILHYGEESVSVAMEEVKSQDWKEKVYKPDIQKNWDKLYKQPGYDVNDL